MTLEGGFNMFVQMICKDRNEKEMNELYEVLGLIARREEVQIEDRYDHVDILVCPQGKIVVTEEDGDMVLRANTRHAGPGFHAFVVDIFKDIQEEIPGEYELIDDMEFDKDEDFDRLSSMYEDEMDYIRGVLLENEVMRQQNYMYDETYFLPLQKENRIFTSQGDLDLKEFKHMNTRDLMDAFYVWNNWERDAKFYKNCALTLLAKEGVGEYTLMNENTIKHANDICEYIEAAYEKDHNVDLPLDAYADLCEKLGRENKLQNAKNMEQEAIQYRIREVYHLFEDARVVASGAAERSYDPVNQALCLMSPYTDEAQWDWLIQASKQPGIVTNLENIMEQDPIQYDKKTIWMDSWQEDGIYVLEAVLRYKEKFLYFHDVCAKEKDLAFLEQCIKESGFTKTQQD
ncbi:hypothetical protein KSW27_09245 [Holdemanella biformis]|nr:hypothetical protein [Holdemanella biformis]MBV3417457.1 hypothetical protein [Holdemanella biformis]